MMTYPPETDDIARNLYVRCKTCTIVFGETCLSVQLQWPDSRFNCLQRYEVIGQNNHNKISGSFPRVFVLKPVSKSGLHF